MMTMASARRVEWRDMRGSIARPRARKKAGRAQGSPAWEELLRTATQEDVGDETEFGERRHGCFAPDDTIAGAGWLDERQLRWRNRSPGCVGAFREDCGSTDKVLERKLAMNQLVRIV